MESKFDGGLLGLIGVNLLTCLVSLITLTIAVPWMVCYKERWISRHTVIDGADLRLTARGFSCSAIILSGCFSPL